MSLKHDIEEYPEMWSKELVTALDDYKNGKRNSKRKLHKFVGREISEYYYNELIERYGAFYRINKDKKSRDTSRKIKEIVCSAVALAVLLGSMVITLGYVLDYGKGTALLYVLLYLWAICYTAKNKSKR